MRTGLKINKKPSLFSSLELPGGKLRTGVGLLRRPLVPAVALALGLGLASSLSGEEQEDIDVAVIATRTAQPALDTPGTTVVLDERRLERAGTFSLQDALRYESGISVPFDFASQDGLIPYLGGGSQGINIRGIEGNRVALQVDGIRQPEDFVSQAFLGAGGPGRVYFDPGVLSQVEIFKGSSSALYGSDALGGTFNARTVSPSSMLGANLDGLRFDNSLTYATVNESINNRVAVAGGNGSLAGSLVYVYRDGSERRNNGETSPNPADFTSHALVATGTARQGDMDYSLVYDRFNFSQNTRGRSAEGPFFGGILVNERVTLDEDRDRERVSLRMENNQPLGGFFEAFEAQAYWQESVAESSGVQQGVAFFQPRNRRNDLKFRTRIVGVDTFAENLFFYGDVSHALRYGIDLSQSRVQSDFRRRDFAPDGSLANEEDRIGMAPSKVDRLGVFIANEFVWGDEGQWSLFPGLRLEHYEVRPDNTDAFLARTTTPAGDSVRAVNYSNTALAPSLTLQYRFTPTWNVFGSYGRGIRNPSAEELNGVFTHGTDFLVVPNPDLEEEQSDSFEIGLQSSGEPVRVRGSVFYNRYRNFLAANQLIEEGVGGDPDIQTTLNLGRVETYGFEVGVHYSLATEFLGIDGWETGGNFTYTRGRDKSAGEPLNTVDPAKVVGYFGISPQAEAWDFRLTGTFVERKRTSRINQNTSAGEFDPVPSFFLLDLEGGYRLSENWEVRASVNNILDRSYQLWSTARRGGGHGGGDGGINTQPGINGSLTLNARF